MRFLDTSHATKQGDVKESLETILASLREVAAQRETEAGGGEDLRIETAS